ncbi:MAG: archease [Chloroflexi bacterium]|nr:archease [Chloroflexota bacterium]
MPANTRCARGHATFDHTADIGLEAWGSTFGEALAEAGLGLQAIVLHGGTVRARDSRTFRVAADDADALVVAWLSELLYALDVHGWLSASFEVSANEEFQLSATARGETLDEARHVLGVGVKAVSYHELAVQCESDAVRIRVIVDV